MERKSLSCVLNLLIENGKGNETYYLFDSNDNLIVKKMSVKKMLGQLGYYVFEKKYYFRLRGSYQCY